MKHPNFIMTNMLKGIVSKQFSSSKIMMHQRFIFRDQITTMILLNSPFPRHWLTPKFCFAGDRIPWINLVVKLTTVPVLFLRRVVPVPPRNWLRLTPIALLSTTRLSGELDDAARANVVERQGMGVLQDVAWAQGIAWLGKSHGGDTEWPRTSEMAPEPVRVDWS